MNQIPESERMALDFDGWLGSQEPVMKERVSKWLDIIPEAERPARKQRLASQFIVAESTGLPPEQVSENWEFERARFAQERGLKASEGLDGGPWFAGVQDDVKFHEKIKAEATFRRDERQIVLGPDDAKDAEGFKNSLAAKVQEAAFAGVPYPDALAAWQESATKSTGWREDRTGVHNDVGREIYERSAATVAKVKPIAEKAFNAIAASRGVANDGSAPDSAPFAMFRGLSADEKQMAFRVMTEKAAAGDSKDPMDAFTEAIGRGFENLGQGSFDAHAAFIGSMSFKVGDKVKGDTLQDHIDEVSKLRSSDVFGITESLDGGGRELTADEAKQWNEEKAAITEDMDTAARLVKFGQEIVDPNNKTGSWAFRKLMLPVADSVAIMAAMSVPGVGMVASLSAAKEQYAGESYRQMRDNGMSEDEARKGSQISGTAQALLDKAGFEFLRGVPRVNQVLKKFAIGGSGAARFAANAGGTFIAESLIEVTQDQVIPALAADLANENPKFDFEWSNVWRDLMVKTDGGSNVLADTMLGMVLLSAAGGGYQTFADSQMTRDLSNSRSAMTLAGYTDVQMDAIQSQPINERAALLSQFAPAKAPVEKEREALIARVVEEAQKERAAFVERLKAETGEVSDAMDYAVRVTRQGAGWTVTTESGKSLVVDTAEAARRIRQDLGQAASQREADTLVAVVEDWHLADDKAQRETTFTGETATSDGTSITYKRDGKITREITDAKTLETIRKEAEVVAQQTGQEAVNVIVNGSNATFAPKVTDAAAQVVQRLEINRSASSVLAFLHESMESNWRAGMQSGTLNREATQKAVAAIAGAFRVDGNNAETRAFNERVQRVADGTASDTELRETVSELAVADIIGRRKDGGSVKVGSISQAISDAIQRAANESDIAGLSKFQAFIRAAKTFFRGVLGTVNAIRKAKMKDGKLAEDWESFMHKLTGTSEQAGYDKGRAEDLNAQLAEANAASENYVPPTAEMEAAGIMFSVSPAQGAEYMAAVKRGDVEAQQRMVDAAAARAGYNVGPVHHNTMNGKFTQFSNDDKPRAKSRDYAGSFSGGAGFYFYQTEGNPSYQSFGRSMGRFFVRIKNPAPINKLFAEILGKPTYGHDVLRIKSDKSAKQTPYERQERLPKTPDTFNFESLTPDAVASLKRMGYDGVVWDGGGNISGNFSADNVWLPPEQVVAFDPSQIKSADPVTRDESGNIIPLSERFNEKSNDIRFSISPSAHVELLQRQVDAEYLLAVKRGDVEAQQRMVDSAAKAAGYETEAYHGTNKDFSIFDTQGRGKTTDAGAFFTTNISNAQTYGKRVLRVFLKESGPIIDANGANWNSLSVFEAFDGEGESLGEFESFSSAQKKAGEDGSVIDYPLTLSDDGSYLERDYENDSESTSTDELAALARRKGFDSITFRNIVDSSQKALDFGLSDKARTPSKVIAVFNPSQIKSADAVTRDESGKVIPLSERFNEKSNDIRFSISPSAHVELLQRQVDAQLKRDPDRSRKLAKRATDKLQSIQFNYETDRVSANGAKTRALVEQRTPESLNKEQAFREAVRREELEDEVYSRNSDIFSNAEMASVWSGPVMSQIAKPGTKLQGRLMSKSAALKAGKFSLSNGDYDGVDGVPRIVFGGETMPNQMAQQLHDMHLIPAPTEEALWNAIKNEVAQSAKWKKWLKEAEAELKLARNTAHEEAAEWRREQDELQKEDWNPKAKTLRYLRELDAVLSVLPPELRAKVGGFVKIVELSTDAARQKEIGKRIEKMGKLVERHLHKESVEAIERLIEKAEPSTGPGEKPKGKITVEGHRVFAATDAARGMAVEQVDAERARLATAIEDRIAKGGDVIDLLEQEQILEMFGAIDEKTAAEADAAATWLDNVYRTGKNAWRMIEEVRLAEVGKLVREFPKGTEAQIQERLANLAKSKAFFVNGGTLSLFSYVQVLEELFPHDARIVKLWNRGIQDATRQKNNAIAASNARMKDAAVAAGLGKTNLEVNRRFFTMQHEHNIDLPKTEYGEKGKSSISQPVTREQLAKFLDGTSDFVTLGYSQPELDDIEAQSLDPANAKKKQFTVTRERAGADSVVKISEFQAIGLTLAYRQERYHKNFEHHGYSEASIAAAEAGISAEGKAFREFFAREYRDNFEPLAAVFRDMFGIDLPQEPNYSPMDFYSRGKDYARGPDDLVDSGGFRASMLISRKAHLAQPQLTDALTAFRGHTAQMEHWRAFAPIVRQMRGVIGDPRVAMSIKASHGDLMLEAVQDWVGAFEQNGIKVAQTPIDRFAQKFTKKSALMILAYNLSTLLKNTIGPATASSSVIGIGNYLTGVKRLLAGKIDVKAMRDSYIIQERLQNAFTPEIRTAMAAFMEGKPSKWKDFMIYGLDVPGRTDAWWTAIGAAIAYDYHLQQGATPEQAMEEAADAVARTAQPVDMANRSLEELKMSGKAKTIFQFASNQRMETASIIAAIQNVRSGKITKQKAFEIIAVRWLWQGIVSTVAGSIVRDLRDDDDDEWLDDKYWNPLDMFLNVFYGPLGGIPLANMVQSLAAGITRKVIQTVGNKMGADIESKPIYGANTPVDGIEKGLKEIGSIGDGDKHESIEKTIHRMDNIAKAAAMIFDKAEPVAVGFGIARQLFDIGDSLLPDSGDEVEMKEKAAISKERSKQRRKNKRESEE